jgi:multiple sugar transport system substrate-binding protein
VFAKTVCTAAKGESIMTSNITGKNVVSRRALIGNTAGIVAASAIAAPALHLGRVSAFAQTPVVSDISGDITEWGFGTAETNPMARARVLAFQAAFPNVNLEIVDSFDEQKLLTAAASDTLPDLLWLSRFQTATWASRDILMPLTEYIERDGYDTSVFYEAALSESTYEDEIYGIPGGMDVRVLYVNLDHLTEIGVDGATLDTSDWEKLNEIGAQLVQRNGDQVARWGFDNKLPAKNFWLWGRGNGGHFMNDDATETTFDDEKIVEALDLTVKTYNDQGGFESYSALATTFQGDEQFAREQVSMTVYEQWMLAAAVANVAPDMNFAVLPIRERGSGPDGKMVSFTGGNGWYITKNAKNPDLAWEYIKYMHTDETWLIGGNALKEMRESQGQPFVPSLTGSKTADTAQREQLYVPVNPAFDDAVALFPELLGQSENREIAKSPVAGQLEDIMAKDGVEPALRGEAAADALETANQNAQDAIDSM